MHCENNSELDVPEPASTPAPMLAGTYAVYEDGAGGYVIVAETSDNATIRKHIPHGLVKMLTGGGLLARKFREVIG